MHKKLMMACMAIAAFAAFVMAPSASAASLMEGATVVPVGTSITGTSSETKFTAGGNTVTCTNADMTGEVTANSGGAVAGKILAKNTSFKGTGSGEDCTSEGLGPVKPTVNSDLCLSVAKGTDTGTVDGCGGPVTFTLTITNLFNLACKYETAKTGISGKITTAAEGKDAEVNLSKQPATGEETNSGLCPGSGELDMEFVLTTTNGTTLTFN